MRTSRLAEPSRQRIARCLKEDHRNDQTLTTQLLQLFGELAQKPAFAKTNHKRRAINTPALISRMHQTRKRRQQRQRHIVDAEIAKIFKRDDRSRHPRSAETGDDDYVWRCLAFA